MFDFKNIINFFIVYVYDTKTVTISHFQYNLTYTKTEKIYFFEWKSSMCHYSIVIETYKNQSLKNIDSWFNLNSEIVNVVKHLVTYCFGSNFKKRIQNKYLRLRVLSLANKRADVVSKATDALHFLNTNIWRQINLSEWKTGELILTYDL